MAKFKHQFLQTLDERGLIAQCSNETGLDEHLNDASLPKAYIGFDCTAPSLHIGNLLAIMALRRFQQAGGQPIIVMGGGTTRIGDPSGKDKTRKILSTTAIEENISSISTCFSRFLDMDKTIIVNNYNWLQELNYIEFLRDIGRHFSVNRMLAMDSVQLRLERQQPLSFIEFNYMIVQAFDFLHLAQEMDCRLQMGGSDQWGNIVNGIELARREGLNELFALTLPLITTQSGEKMGKTADGAIWLNHNEEMLDFSLSPYHYWQFWRNSKDLDVGKFLRLFTDLSIDEIERLEKLEGEEINEAKKVLADEATSLAHGKDNALKAAEAALQGFEGSGVSENMPTIEVEEERLKAGLGLLEALVLARLTASNSEARRFVKARAVRVGNEVVEDEKMILSKNNLDKGKFIQLSVGKKNIALLKMN